MSEDDAIAVRKGSTAAWKDGALPEMEENKSVIDVTNINEKIYTLIKRRITHLEYPPGHQINIRKLQAELGVSNSPIKDALFRLAGEELVEITSRKGTFVRDISEEDIQEIEEVRSILEAGAVEVIAPEITDEQLAHLENLYRETLMSANSFEYSAFMEKDSRFHQAIIELTENRRLIKMYRRLNAHVQIVRFQFARNRNRPLPWTDQDHREILEALKARDPERAKAAIGSHRRKARDAFLETREPSSETERRGS